nr:immunoglobulin-like domain-containing protein [uncultured Acetatifactor sp.]
MHLKRIIAGFCVVMLFAASAAGACFFLRKGAQRALETQEPALGGIQDITVETGEGLPDLKKGLKANRAVKDVTVDVSQVDTETAGVYEIMYHYTGTSGKKYEQKATCTVTDKKAPPPGGGEPAPGTLKAFGERKPQPEEVKTGDVVQTAAYAALAVLSLGIAAWQFIQMQAPEEKKEESWI